MARRPYRFPAVGALCALGAALGASGCSAPSMAGGSTSPAPAAVLMFGDSARAVIPTPRWNATWRWNDPASRRWSPSGEHAVVTRSMQHGWWARIGRPSRFELNAYQFSDHYGATRVDSLSRLLREAQTCICVRSGPEGRGTSDAKHHFPELEDSGVFARAEPGAVVLVLRGRAAVQRVFAGRPDSATVYRALPWPRVDSLRVPVRYID